MATSDTSGIEKGTTEFLVLSLVEHEARHGYELYKLIESRSRGVVTLYVASLYPMLYRLEKRGLIAGRWVEKAGQRRRRFYRITSSGREVLDRQRHGWREFVAAINRVTRPDHA
jgi:transcriptional regulator